MSKTWLARSLRRRWDCTRLVTALAAALPVASCRQQGVELPGPYQVSVESATRQATWGDPVPYELFIPQPADDLPGPPWPAVVLTHGFARDRSLLRNNAMYMAQRGLVVLTPNMDGLLEGEAAQLGNILNTADHVAWLAQRSRREGDALFGLLDPQRIGLAGHSSGGAVSFEAAVEAQATDTPAAALLLLDGTAWRRTLERAGELQPLPFASLRSEPASCNRFGNVRELLAGLTFPVQDVRIVGATHCDAENPTDTVCIVLCDGVSQTRQMTYQRLMYLFFRDSLGAPVLPDDQETYEAALELLEVAGTVTVEPAP